MTTPSESISRNSRMRASGALQAGEPWRSLLHAFGDLASMSTFRLARRPPRWLHAAFAALLVAFALNSIAHVTHRHDASASVTHSLACGYCATFGGLADAPRQHPVVSPISRLRTSSSLPNPQSISPCASGRPPGRAPLRAPEATSRPPSPLAARAAVAAARAAAAPIHCFRSRLVMDVSTSLRIAVAAVLVSSSAFAQESRLEEIVVTSTALRENPLEIAQPTTVVAGDDLRGRSRPASVRRCPTSSASARPISVRAPAGP